MKKTIIIIVITIVVLLIISAVIIATLTGDNGLITKAFSANRASREVEIKEKIQLAASAAEIINYGELRKNEFDIELEKEFGKKIPLHITRFFPRFKFADCDPTPVSKIRRLVDVAKERLEFVFAGNV